MYQEVILILHVNIACILHNIIKHISGHIYDYTGMINYQYYVTVEKSSVNTRPARAHDKDYLSITCRTFLPI